MKSRKYKRMCCHGFGHSVVSQVYTSISEKHAVSIFRTEVTRLGSGELDIGFEEQRLREREPIREECGKRTSREPCSRL
jgi:hypothetical protein